MSEIKDSYTMEASWSWNLLQPTKSVSSSTYVLNWRKAFFTGAWRGSICFIKFPAVNVIFQTFQKCNVTKNIVIKRLKSSYKLPVVLNKLSYQQHQQDNQSSNQFQSKALCSSVSTYVHVLEFLEYKNSSDVAASDTAVESPLLLKFWEHPQNRYLKKSPRFRFFRSSGLQPDLSMISSLTPT